MLTRLPRSARIFLLLGYVVLAWFALQLIEQELNPLGWNLEFAQEMRDYVK